MRHLVRIIALNASVLISVILVIVSFKSPQEPLTGGQWFFICLTAAIMVFIFTFDFFEWRRRNWKDIRGSVDIRNYMYQWIDSASSAAIFSRDMSWVQDDGMKAMLREKARSNSLALVLPREIPLSADLEHEGAEVYYYPEIDYLIKSRFTVVDLDSHNTRVAIGRTEGDRHRIEEISAGGDPSLYLAIDMLEIVRRFVSRSHDT